MIKQANFSNNHNSTIHSSNLVLLELLGVLGVSNIAHMLQGLSCCAFGDAPRLPWL